MTQHRGLKSGDFKLRLKRGYLEMHLLANQFVFLGARVVDFLRMGVKTYLMVYGTNVSS
jgi:hypothetical protein